MANLKHAEDDPKHVKMPGEIPGTCAQKTGEELSSVVGAHVSEVPCSIPSFAAASELVSAPYSCLVMNTHRRHVAMPPLYLNKKRTGLREELDAELLKYSPSLKGVPIAYDNIRIVGQHGGIYDDSGYIHMDIEANFIIFQPMKGQRLLGKVNKLGVSHVGCLVHSCFNASIPKPNLVSVDTWREAGPRIGAELEFEVTTLDADTVGVLLIRGKLDRTKVQELLAMAETSETDISVNQLELQETEAAAEPPEESVVEDSAKKKKKKKKDKIKEEAMEEETVQDSNNATLERNGTESDANDNEPGEKKKKKKKEKRIKEEEEQVHLSPTEIHASDSSGYHSDKPSKKRKHETEHEDILSGFSQEAPKSKKKRKSDIV
ncbi:DNA-directed RNA polymerase I subunit RPA43 [Dunckerocampus dactyliophorus]|uniref:DNA-directed RNA polymerase I subunit RPA43 n=1 Tax=Dunckerocampus dactyliophorus TaxID=161453 RepID=UPI0024065E80|nr:DNA-directed RNA polymerase I subunit RPA43 [Dunckerocampus dactyliophorus]